MCWSRKAELMPGHATPIQIALIELGTWPSPTGTATTSIWLSPPMDVATARRSHRGLQASQKKCCNFILKTRLISQKKRFVLTTTSNNIGARISGDTSNNHTSSRNLINTTAAT